ncbi:MAG: Na+/H+ antiporter NhaA [Burkholderiales bacterium]
MTDNTTPLFPREAAPGLVLMAATALAMLCSNSGLAIWYEGVLDLPIEIRIGAFRIAKPLLLWVNDGLMAVFFFLVGLELKREILEGELSSPAQLMLPAVAALGGMAVPAAIYAALNHADPVALNGWAIPAATDIAFALGVLILLGNRVPVSLKVFLTAVAIVDDLGAVVIIALFYTDGLSATMLAAAAVGVAVLVTLNLAGVRKLAPYALVGVAVWVCLLKSGVHATLAGVIAALCVPMGGRGGDDRHSPLKSAEHALHGWVAYGVIPVFAFANAGVSLYGLTLATFGHSVPLGIAMGLFAGKVIGIFGACALAIRLFGAALPGGASWLQLLGISTLGGIGFTMSLFIGSLAFENAAAEYMKLVKLGVLAGSCVSAVVGVGILLAAARNPGRARTTG